MTRVAIVGGGLTGLSAAYELTKSSFEVELFEAESELGGLAGSFSVADTRLEKFYHHWFTSDHDIISLINELGLSKKVSEVDSNTAVYVGNSFFKLSNPRDLLLFTPLSLFARFRLGVATLLIKYISNWKKLENITAVDWLKNFMERKFRILFGHHFLEESLETIGNQFLLFGCGIS